MEFELKQFDTPLLRFSAEPQSADPNYKIAWINEDKKSLLPLGFEVSEAGLASWIKGRAIPKNRAFVSTFLARNGLSENRPLSIIMLCKGLSLNDSYWVTEEGNGERFDDCNLYDNRMSRLLAQIAFTGYGSSSVRSGFSSSPEFTTNGMLPKCWRRIGGSVQLYKGATTGAANAGFEPYSEYYATDIAGAMNVAHVDYNIHRWKGILCSSCELFTSKDVSFVPVGRLVKSGGFAAVVDYCQSLGDEFTQALSDMLAFDAIICNTDRHLGNFGFLVDNKMNKIIASAPLFDHGNALFYQAYGQDWESLDALCAYADTQNPCLYDDFFATAEKYITRETRAKVRGLLEFKFSRGVVKGFPRKRLQLIEKVVRLRAQRLCQ